MTLPLSPAQEVIDGLAASALATLGSAGPGFVDGAGGADLDPTKLQPQVASAQFLPTDPATLQETIEGLLNLQVPPPLPVDSLALLQALPDGIPDITYRLCSETATLATPAPSPCPSASPSWPTSPATAASTCWPTCCRR